MKAARTEQSEEAREANRRWMKPAREEQSDEARAAAREADKHGKQAARAEQSDKATGLGRRPGRKISVGRRRLVSVYVSFRSPTTQKKRRR
jgi:hypothetical protein